MPGAEEDFKIWVQAEPRGPGQLGSRGAMLKTGPRVAKSVTISDFGDPTTGELRNRTLRVRTYPRSASRPGYDFDAPTANWSCEDEEIERLLAFLHSEVATTGRYRVIDSSSPAAALQALIDEHGDNATALVTTLLSRSSMADVVQGLTLSSGGLAAAETAVLERRRAIVAELQAMAVDPATRETDMQRAMDGHYWLFGGRYVGTAARRNLVPMDQHDFALLGADGTLHIVELKGPHVPGLVRQHRSHYVVGGEVHLAASQAMNYLRALDEAGSGLSTMYQNELGLDYDMRRVFATVVIGHANHVTGLTARQVEQTIRTYNSHLSRVEVVTYATLLDAAEQALVFDQARVDDAGPGVATSSPGVGFDREEGGDDAP